MQYLTKGLHDFQVGNQITHLNNCRVTDEQSWNQCLSDILRDSSFGFCLDDSYLSDKMNGDALCCNDSALSNSHLCFFTLPMSSSNNRYCLRARQVTNLSNGWCHEHNGCSVKQSCLVPLLSNENGNETDSTKFIEIKRHGENPILFIGQPQEIYSSVYISNYTPRTILGPIFAHRIEYLLRYLISFSAGLAMLNVVPCVYMDGQHIANAVSEIITNGRHNVLLKIFIKNVLIFVGTLLVVVNILLGLLVLIIK